MWQVWCVPSAAGGEGVVGDVVGGGWRVVVVVVAGLLGGCGVGGWLCVWWRVGAPGGGDGVSLRVVLGVVPLGVWFAITEPSGRWRRVLTRPSGRRLLRSRQGLGSLPGAHTSLRTAAVS